MDEGFKLFIWGKRAGEVSYMVIARNVDEARAFFRRAFDLPSSMGTPVEKRHPVIVGGDLGDAMVFAIDKDSDGVIFVSGKAYNH